MDILDPSVSHEIVDAVSTVLCGLLDVSLMWISRGLGGGGGSSIGTICKLCSRHADASGDIGDARKGV